MSGTPIIPGYTVNNWTLSQQPTTVRGWTSGPNSRGTMDIIWGSFLTIFLCTWTVVCLNLPAPKDSDRTIFMRRTRWMLWAIIGPELVLSVAIGQFASARRSVKRFRQLGHHQWTLRHGFFADMGGFILRPNDDLPSYPVNARQLAYLVQHGYTEIPDITAAEIWDKSKADTMTKILTLIQASWMLVSLVGRAFLHMTISTLELSAGAIVFCTFGTFICWLHKPSDAKRGIVIAIAASTSQILTEGGNDAARPYRHTPLDFVAKEHFTCGYDVMGYFGLRCDSRERPLTRFPNDRFPDISTFEKFALFCMTTAYAALHLIGWNFFFPTRTETILWRVSSLIMIGTTVFFWLFETIMARQRFGRWDKYWRLLGFKKRSVESPESAVVVADGKGSTTIGLTVIEKMDAFEAEQKNSKPLSAAEVLLILPIVLSYAAARAYLIVEPLVALRELPLGAFRTFQIIQLLPHW